MRLLIDGYNLLHATDLFGAGALAGTLEGSREALLEFLAERLTERERRRTTIVFDAADAPPGLPAEAEHEGIRVRYARDFADADAMLEALIERARAPKELLVVSSDRRVQRAARRRGAAWVESAAWYAELRPRRPASPPSPAKPAPPDAPSVAYWVERFSEGMDDPTAGDQQPTKSAGEAPTADNPFPPGYADDLSRRFNADDPPPPEGG